jgi:hypothetical protein
VTTTIPELGQLVLVRNRAFVVLEVQKQGLPTSAPGANHANHLVKLSSVEDDGLGEEADVIWELVPGATVQDRLLALNHQCYAEEVEAGLHDKKKSGGAKARRNKSGPPAGQCTLFDCV